MPTMATASLTPFLRTISSTSCAVMRGRVLGLVAGIACHDQTPARGKRSEKKSQIGKLSGGDEIASSTAGCGDYGEDAKKARLPIFHLLDVGFANGIDTVSELFLKSQPKRTSERLEQPVSATAAMRSRKRMF
ncbi:MAG: hypothetical protein EBR82_11645 [Caulobacteraceae bacterium]|nr:hypothetical protein [Caulobacteraceae bacterium]